MPIPVKKRRMLSTNSDPAKALNNEARPKIVRLASNKGLRPTRSPIGAQRLPAAGLPALHRPRRPSWRGNLHGSDFTWAIAFVVPYAAVFLAFAVYPIGYALWMGSKPSLYVDLIDDPLYLQTAVNT